MPEAEVLDDLSAEDALLHMAGADILVHTGALKCSRPRSLASQGWPPSRPPLIAL